jgi:succinoglycan biosynthesis protein ExoW
VAASQEINMLNANEQVTQAYLDKIRVISQTNGGAASARNAGLDSLSPSTLYVAFCDSDDIWESDHLQRAYILHEAKGDFYFSNFYHLGSDVPAFERADRINLPQHQALDCDRDELYEYRGNMPQQILTANVIGTSTVVYRLASAPDLRFREDLKLAGEDYMFWLMLTISGKRCLFSNKPTVVYGEGVNIFSGATWGSTHLVKRNADFLAFNTEVFHYLTRNAPELSGLVVSLAPQKRSELVSACIAALKRGRLRSTGSALITYLRNFIQVRA